MYADLITKFLASDEAKPYFEDETKLPSCLGAYLGKVWKSFTIPPLDTLMDEVKSQREI